MVRVDEQLRARVRTRLRQRRQPGDDPRVLEEHRRDEHRARARSLGGQPLGKRLHRPGREPDDVEPLLPQPPELAPQRVELAVGRDELRPLPQRQRGQEPQHELVRVRSERDRRAGVVEQPPHALAQPLRLRERPLPLEIRVLGRVLPRLELPLAPDVGPRLVRVPGQQQPLGDAELRVVLRERVQSSLRTAQRSGKNGLCSVERRYSAP